jgi:D-alanine-D-alanine ligase
LYASREGFDDSPAGAAKIRAVSKLRVGIVFGGRSTEHEVSVTSATTIFQAMDPARYLPVLIGIDHDGGWRVAEPELSLLPEAVFDCADAARARPALGAAGLELLRADGRSALAAPLDAVFPIVHGRGGEDGSLQGLLELAGVPYVGPGVASTALCMDKLLSKRVLRDAGIPIVPALEAPRAELLADSAAFAARAIRELGLPLFVKPSNTGSSVGVEKARDERQLREALQRAARYDHHVLVESAIDAREIEFAVLGGNEPQASVAGEITYTAEYYDYEAKYASDRTRLWIPADLPEPLAEELRGAAIAAFRALKCWGMARADFFVERGTGRWYANELNTLPGFTDGSMYPRLWAASGIALPELIDRLIELALERQRAQAQLVVRFTS